MNPVQKHLKLVSSKPRPAVSYRDGSLLEEEEGQCCVLAEENTTDSSLVITIGNIHTPDNHHAHQVCRQVDLKLVT